MKYRWISLWLVAICAIIFIFQMAIPGLTDAFVLQSSDVIQRPWTLVTSMFLHGGLEHLIYNMFALALFGLILEKIIGSKKFIILYFIAGIIAGVGSAMFYESSLGASGAIMGILGCLAMLRPRMTVYISYVPMPMAAAAAVWAGGDLLGMFAPDNIAHAAHLFGMFFGLVVGFYYRKQFGEKFVRRRIEPISDREARTWEDRWL